MNVTQKSSLELLYKNKGKKSFKSKAIELLPDLIEDLDTFRKIVKMFKITRDEVRGNDKVLRALIDSGDLKTFKYIERKYGMDSKFINIDFINALAQDGEVEFFLYIFKRFFKVSGKFIMEGYTLSAILERENQREYTEYYSNSEDSESSEESDSEEEVEITPESANRLKIFKYILDKCKISAKDLLKEDGQGLSILGESVRTENTGFYIYMYDKFEKQFDKLLTDDFTNELETEMRHYGNDQLLKYMEW